MDDQDLRDAYRRIQGIQLVAPRTPDISARVHRRRNRRRGAIAVGACATACVAIAAVALPMQWRADEVPAAEPTSAPTKSSVVPPAYPVYFTFGLGESETPDIYVQADSSSQPQPAIATGNNEYAPDMSTATGGVVFAAMEGERDAEIFVQLEGDDDRQQLTEGPGTAGAPKWSPDGSQIAFWRESGDGRPQIHLYDVDRGEETSLTDSFGPSMNPWWAPDGRSLFYTQFGADSFELMQLDLESRETSRVASVENPRGGTTSPDGNSVVVQAGRGAFGSSVSDPIVMLDVQTGNEVWRSDQTFAMIDSIAWTSAGIRVVEEDSDRLTFVDAPDLD